jgi:hypothetical protein
MRWTCWSESLEANTALAAELFGMGTMVYVNFYFSSNVVDEPSYKLLLDKREVVRHFVRTCVPPANSSLQYSWCWIWTIGWTC